MAAVFFLLERGLFQVILKYLDYICSLIELKEEHNHATCIMIGICHEREALMLQKCHSILFGIGLGLVLLGWWGSGLLSVILLQA